MLRKPPLGSCEERVVDPNAEDGRARCPRHKGDHYKFISILWCSVASDCTHRDQSDSSLIAELVHLTLFLSVEQTVLILHRYELGPTILLGAELHHGELISPHGARSDITNLTHLNEIVQSFHCFFNGRLMVETMNL